MSPIRPTWSLLPYKIFSQAYNVYSIFFNHFRKNKLIDGEGDADRISNENLHVWYVYVSALFSFSCQGNQWKKEPSIVISLWYKKCGEGRRNHRNRKAAVLVKIQPSLLIRRLSVVAIGLAVAVCPLHLLVERIPIGQWTEPVYSILQTDDKQANSMDEKAMCCFFQSMIPQNYERTKMVHLRTMIERVYFCFILTDFPKDTARCYWGGVVSNWREMSRPNDKCSMDDGCIHNCFHNLFETLFRTIFRMALSFPCIQSIQPKFRLAMCDYLFPVCQRYRL